MNYDATKEKNMITTPLDWPHWPRLPLKHRRREFGAEDYCGYLLATSTPPWVVYVGVMFLDMKLCGVEEYGTLEALMQDWRVD